MSLFKRLLRWLFKRYQLMLLEPEGGHTVRNMHINAATVLALILLVSLGSAALVWFYAPPRSANLSAHYYRLQQQYQAANNKLAVQQGEYTLVRARAEGLKNELLANQQIIEDLRKKLNIYDSILKARKNPGVRILRASASLQEGDQQPAKIKYALVLVKGGNYPRRVTGSVRIVALGDNGKRKLLKLGKSKAELPYKMDSHAFLDGVADWKQSWRPRKLEITRLNFQGAERDQMIIALNEGPDSQTVDSQTTEAVRPAEKGAQVEAGGMQGGNP